MKKRAISKDVWPIDEDSKKIPQGWCGWPEGKKFALVLQHDVDTQKGHDKCYELMAVEKNLGFRSSFLFVPERYNVDSSLRKALRNNGFEVGVHGLVHDGKLFTSRKIFDERSEKINAYLKEWQVNGFSSPSMHRNFNWMHSLNITHATSSFDTDPFEPYPCGVKSIFPFLIQCNSKDNGYIELPYTMPQDFTIFILMKEKNINTWKRKLNWIVENGGMVLLNSHPDYMCFSGEKCSYETYPFTYYKELLEYVVKKYEGMYWHVLPEDIARFWKNNMC